MQESNPPPHPRSSVLNQLSHSPFIDSEQKLQSNHSLISSMKLLKITCPMKYFIKSFIRNEICWDFSERFCKNFRFSRDSAKYFAFRKSSAKISAWLLIQQEFSKIVCVKQEFSRFILEESAIGNKIGFSFTAGRVAIIIMRTTDLAGMLPKGERAYFGGFQPFSGFTGLSWTWKRLDYQQAWRTLLSVELGWSWCVLSKYELKQLVQTSCASDMIACPWLSSFLGVRSISVRRPLLSV